MKNRFIIIIVSVFILSSFNCFAQPEISGEAIPIAYQTYRYNLFPNNAANVLDEVVWEMEDLNEVLINAGSISIVDYMGRADVIWNDSYIGQEIKLIANVHLTTGNVVKTSFSVTPAYGTPDFSISYNPPTIGNYTSAIYLNSNLPYSSDIQVTWETLGNDIIQSVTNTSVNVIWSAPGPNKVTANIIYNGSEIIQRIAYIDVPGPDYYFKPQISGKTVVNLNENIKYDLKTELPSQVQTTWSAIGGTIINQDNSGAVVNWSSTNGTLIASVDFVDGLDPYITELEVTQAPNMVSPYTGATSTNENYVKTTIYQEPTLTDQNASIKKTETIQYIDELGRAKQTIALEAGGNKQDIITHIEYDVFSRQAKNYLPYASARTNSAFRTNAKDETFAFYNTSKYENTLNPFTEMQFDGSALNRGIKSSAPGADWDAHILEDHTIRTIYDVAKNEDNVRGLGVSYDSNGNHWLTTDSEGMGIARYKQIVKNENWKLSDGKNNTTENYTDYQNRTLLKRVYNEGVPHDTYYVYDDFENLVFVIPPKVTFPVSLNEIEHLCYQYIYGYRNRLIEKKIPGKGWEYIVYDKLDRPILNQDANLRKSNDWLYVKYDAFGRVIYTGKHHYVPNGHKENSGRLELQEAINQQSTVNEERLISGISIDGTSIFYSNNVLPNTNIEVYTINYYDDYNVNLETVLAYQDSYGQTLSQNNKGLATINKVRVLETNKWITSASYYDDYARLIYSVSINNYLGTLDWSKLNLDFVGNIIETTTEHKKEGQANINIVDIFTYDHANRLSSHLQNINGVEDNEVIVSNTYDELGQLIVKGVGGKEKGRLQYVDYTYNIRGWLKTINDSKKLMNDLFAFKINYNTADHGAEKLFNGNISETEWITQNDNKLRWYGYNYDDLNRLTSAKSSSKDYDVPSVRYDKNGNINSLVRIGHVNENATEFGFMDELYYEYEPTSNKLKNVADKGDVTYGFKDGSENSTEYFYDSNGNMTIDENKGIKKIEYNHLNLPTYIEIAGAEEGDIRYIYDATGIKLKKMVSTDVYTEYAGSFIYENDKLQFFSQPEGYVEPEGEKYNYVYQYKDHLNNIRLSYSDGNNDGSIDSNTEIISEKNYYPFGLLQKGYNSIVSANANSSAEKFMFGGKEYQEELGLEWYDVTARNYDPALGRWMNLDPLAEKMRRHSPYNYAFDNPVYFIDYDGMMPSGGIEPPKKLVKLWRMVKRDLFGSQSSKIKKFKRDTKPVRDFLDKADKFVKGDGPREVREEGVVTVGDEVNHKGMESIPVATQDADVTTVDEDVINTFKGGKSKYKGPNKNLAKSLNNGIKDGKVFKKTIENATDAEPNQSSTNTGAGGTWGEKITIPVGTLTPSTSGYSGNTLISSPASVTITQKDTTVNNTGDAARALEKANLIIEKKQQEADRQNEL